MKGYRQAILQHGDHTKVSWIPVKFASPGRVVTFLDDPTQWVVVRVFREMDREFIDKRSRDFRTQRTVSDI